MNSTPKNYNKIFKINYSPTTVPPNTTTSTNSLTTSSATKNGIRAMDVEKYKKNRISRKLRKIRKKLNKLYP